MRRVYIQMPVWLDAPELIKKNYEDYKKILAGEVKIN